MRIGSGERSSGANSGFKIYKKYIAANLFVLAISVYFCNGLS